VNRTVALVQARVGSTRLPGKVLMHVAGAPLLAHVVDRTRRARRVDEVVVATTTQPGDDSIERLALARGWPVTRGSEDDVLDRFVQAARVHDAGVVVRITADCPLMDPTIIDDVIDAYAAGDWDYASNTLDERTYPRGLDVEVIGRDALERAWRDDADPARREHVTPYVYRHPELFRLLPVPGPIDASQHRWCVDTPEDLHLVRWIYAALGRDDFGWREALHVVEQHPEWEAINRDVEQKATPP
jgi:spore coat polysaccharide biosynthesis protein SpsF